MRNVRIEALVIQRKFRNFLIPAVQEQQPENASRLIKNHLDIPLSWKRRASVFTQN
jgi:hypothetical protein